MLLAYNCKDGIAPTLWAGYGKMYLAGFAWRGGVLIIQTRDGKSKDIPRQAGARPPKGGLR